MLSDKRQITQHNKRKERLRANISMRQNPNATRPDARNTRSNPERGDRQSHVKMPRMSGGRRREGWLLPLCLLLPPIGVAYMWAMQRFSKRSRVVISAISGLILFAECYFMFAGSAGMPDPTTFTPGAGSVYAPTSVTAEPTEIPAPTELPYDIVQAQPSAYVGEDGVAVTADPNAFIPNPDPIVTAPPAIDGGEAAQPVSDVASADTIVFTSSGALFYHANPSCGGKDYSEQTTLAQAIERGLAPCNNCNPPSQVG